MALIVKIINNHSTIVKANSGDIHFESTVKTVNWLTKQLQPAKG